MKGKKRDYREDLMDEAVDRSEGSFSKGTRVLTNLPEGYEFVKLQKGNNLLDIIPFEIKSSNYPKKDKGRIAYHLFINVHRFVGPGEQHNFVCLTQYGKKCPVCEFLQANKSKLSEDEAKKLKPKQRVYYNVIVLTDNIKNKKISLLESSYFEFESKLKEEFQYKLNENNGIVPFSDPEEGLSVMVRGSERVFLGRTSIEPKKFDFVERKNQHSENIIDEAVSFDEFLNVLSYEEMFSLFHGVGEIEDVEEEDDDSEEEVKQAADHPEERKRREKTRSSIASIECPEGHVFGKDYDNYTACEECKKWKSCMEKFETSFNNDEEEDEDDEE